MSSKLDYTHNSLFTQRFSEKHVNASDSLQADFMTFDGIPVCAPQHTKL